jgi:hypothetical protein
MRTTKYDTFNDMYEYADIDNVKLCRKILKKAQYIEYDCWF